MMQPCSYRDSALAVGGSENDVGPTYVAPGTGLGTDHAAKRGALFVR
jgi:hypothetical protein